ncbi:hypothetical protein, partial [Salmonella enterica]
NKNIIKSKSYAFIFVISSFFSTQIYTLCFLLSPAVHASMMIAGDLSSVSAPPGFTTYRYLLSRYASPNQTPGLRLLFQC